MDIHRCRFVPYPPSAINAVAFNYPTAATKGKASKLPVRLAIGRANGDIEIWNPINSIWHHESTLHGGKDRSIDGLVWVNEPNQQLPNGQTVIGKSRLFSIGYTSTVTEWDLEKGRPKKQVDGTHGDIWCLAAQPTDEKAKHSQTTKLVAGTIDGRLVLYSLEDGDLQVEKVLARSSSKKTKMVSIAFQNRNIVLVGCSDSCIRVYDMRNGALLRKMTLGSDLVGGAKEIIVWSVKCLNGRDIVSGDSTGQVCIWDGKTYTQAQRLQSHKQDVLSLATSADGTAIFSGGMDRKTVLYRQTSGSTVRWSRVWHRRYHSHDVKTMASFEGLGISVVVSGGPDASPLILPLQETGMENHRTLPFLPQSPPLLSSARNRLVVSWWEREVHIWRIKKEAKDLIDGQDTDSSVGKNKRLLARILVKGEANITSATISEDGSLLFVATTSDVKAFHLVPRSDSKRDDLGISKIDLPLTVSERGATRVQLSPDGLWLCLIQEGSNASILRIMPDADPSEKPALRPKAIKLQRINRKIPKHLLHGGLGAYEQTITHIAFSPDSKMVAVADMAGYIDTWVLRKAGQNGAQKANGTNDAEDSSDADSSDDEAPVAQDDIGDARWIRNPNAKLVPKLRAAPTALSFSNHIPSTLPYVSLERGDEQVDDYTLLAVTANPQVLFVHPTTGSLTAWAKRNPISRFPVEFRNVRDLVKGVMWAGDRVWLYGISFLFMIDLTHDMEHGEQSDEIPEGLLLPGEVAHQSSTKKRKRGTDTGAGGKMTKGAQGPTKVVRHAAGEAAQEFSTSRSVDAMDTDATSAPEDDSESDGDLDDDDSEQEGELALLRKAQSKLLAKTGSAEENKGLGFWHTYKYRPILGMVPLGETVPATTTTTTGEEVAVRGAETTPMLEVALVERPFWETDMPARYAYDNEWER